MCGRIVLDDGVDEISERFRAQNITDALRQLELRTYNGAPSQTLPVVVERADGEREIVPMQWGLVPRWQPKDGRAPVKPINARAETLPEKPMFRNLIKSRRCVVPASGFYEWRPTPDGKQPMYLTAEDGALWGLAGLWDSTHDEDRDVVGSFTILTTGPNALVSPIHNRMPVILARDAEDPWLAPDITAPEALESFLRPYPAAQMVAYPVSRAVNNTRHNGPELIEPVDAEEGDR